jgi:transposase InsO family protein
MHPDKPISERRKDIHEDRFESKYVDYLWHTDLHEISIPDEETAGRRIIYLMGFLDYALRFIMHHRLIFNKTAGTCAAVLLDAFELWSPPYVLGSENGGEFVGGKVVEILVEKRIWQWSTKPYTPQQNGKMERFCGTIERCRDRECNEALIGRIITHYNTKWVHETLLMTPERGREIKTNWQSPLAKIVPGIARNLRWTA